MPAQFRRNIAVMSLPTALWLLAVLMILFTLWGADSMRR